MTPGAYERHEAARRSI